MHTSDTANIDFLSPSSARTGHVIETHKHVGSLM